MTDNLDLKTMLYSFYETFTGSADSGETDSPEIAPVVEEKEPAPPKTGYSHGGGSVIPVSGGFLLAMLFIGCAKNEKPFPPGEESWDNDEDGVLGYEDKGIEKDCDDEDPASFPGNPERCGDGIDNDCNGEIDDDLAVDQKTFFADKDGDGFGDRKNSVDACEQPDEFVTNRKDCDDSSAAVHPGAEEVCDGVDNDCDGTTDVGATDVITVFTDADGDGFGLDGSEESICPEAGAVTVGGDCDDTKAQVNPSAQEVCNDGFDNNCDGVQDEAGAIGETDFFEDLDGDTFGNPNVLVQACGKPLGFVTNSDDCDDSEALAFTGAAEVCDGVDNDCDGTIDVGAVDCGGGGGFPDDDDLSSADAKYTGEGVKPQSAASATTALDMDGDGLFELAIGSPQINTGGNHSGAAYVGYGSDPFIFGTRALNYLEAKLFGWRTGDRAGSSVAAAGNIVTADASGLADLAIGAPARGIGGSVHLVPGSPTPILGNLRLNQPTYMEIEGLIPDGGFGAAISGNFNVNDDVNANGDDNIDIVIGAPGIVVADKDGDGNIDGDTNGDGIVDYYDDLLTPLPGSAYVVHGPVNASQDTSDANTTRFIGKAVNDRLGAAVLAAGDLDGDGNDDVVLGAFKAGLGGEIYVFYGPVPAGIVDLSLTDADATITAAGAGHDFGFSLGGTGNLTLDLDGDGVPDDLNGDGFPEFVSDVNGDGIPDFTVGAPGGDVAYTIFGSAVRLSGTVDIDSLVSNSQAAEIQSPTPGIGFGASVAIVGDLDGDGFADELVGAPLDDSKRGAVYNYAGFGITGTVTSHDGKLTGEAEGDRAGSCVGFGGDMNGDGLLDFFICAEGEQAFAGATYVYLGESP